MVRFTKLIAALLAITFGAIIVNGEQNNTWGCPMYAQEVQHLCRVHKEESTPHRRARRWLLRQHPQRARPSAEVNKCQYSLNLGH